MKKIIIILFHCFFVSLLSCQTSQTTEKSKFLSKQELNQRSTEELRIIRNEIFARKGYIFNDTVLSNHFSSYDWYIPNKSVDITLSDREKEYINLIKIIEKTKNRTDTNATIFDILNKLPLNLGSWEWPYENRKLFKENVLKGETKISNDDGLFEKQYINQTKIRVNVVDGVWILKLYTVDNNRYLVITDDIVGGGNDLKSFIYLIDTNSLSEIPFDSLFQNKIIDYFLKEGNTCKEELEENNFEAFLKYNFDGKKLSMQSYIDSEEYRNCFQFQKLIFAFNEKNGKFDFIEGSMNMD